MNVESDSADFGKSALVTGGAQRIGRAISESLAACGWHVAIHYGRSHDEAGQLASDIVRSGGRAEAIGGDLGDLRAAAQIVEAAKTAVGPLTLLINNAAVYEPDSIGCLDVTRWNHQLTVNLGAPLFLAEAFVSQIPTNVEGNIINLLDSRVFNLKADYLSYQLSKSALFVATQTLAKALAPSIRVNAIAPGPTLPSTHTSPDRFAKRTAALPLQRAPELADFGRAVRYLVENKSITGQVISLDGGQSIA